LVVLAVAAVLVLLEQRTRAVAEVLIQTLFHLQKDKTVDLE
jgi:hypothetical protein